jgi:hypothetical protein
MLIQMRLVVGSLALLAVLSCGCGSKSVQIDPALARLVSSDAVALAGIKADELRATPLYRKYIASRLDDQAAGASELLIVYDGRKATAFGKSKSAVFELGSKVPPRPAKGGIPAGLREKVRAIPPQNQIWAVGIGSFAAMDGAIPSEGNFSNLRNVLSAIESWSVHADLRSGLKAESNGVYRTEADAKTVHDGLRGLLGLGRLTTPSDAPELLRFYDAIQITQQQKTVRVTADIPADALDQFLARLDRPGRRQTR